MEGTPCTPPPHGPRSTSGTGAPQQVGRLGGEICDLVTAAGEKSMNCISRLQAAARQYNGTAAHNDRGIR